MIVARRPDNQDRTGSWRRQIEKQRVKTLAVLDQLSETANGAEEDHAVCDPLDGTVSSENILSIRLHKTMNRQLETCIASIDTEDVKAKSSGNTKWKQSTSGSHEDTKIMSVSDLKEDDRSSARRPMVLVITDNESLRCELEEKLSQSDYRVAWCSNPRTALHILEQQRFDVCLTDVAFDDMTAKDLIQRVRQSPTSGEPSMIVVADPAEKMAAADCIDEGADDCVFWPADEQMLHSRILASLRRTNIRLMELSKYLPPDVLDEALEDRNLLETPRPADVSVMVCDVRGFSRISDRVGPVQTIAWIRDIMNNLSEIVLDHGGTIVDYVGDEIMAMWGAPIASSQHASDACYCAMSIQSSLKKLSAKWHPIIGTETRIGIGINSGLAVVGNTGSSHRVKYGPHGHAVNMASRVQGATKYLHSPVLIAQSTASRIDARMRGRRICCVKVHNIHEPVDLFELATCATQPMDLNGVAYEKALVAYEAKDLWRAQELLAKLLLDHPDDGPAKLLLMRVIQAQLSDDFDPVWTLTGK